MRSYENEKCAVSIPESAPHIPRSTDCERKKEETILSGANYVLCENNKRLHDAIRSASANLDRVMGSEPCKKDGECPHPVQDSDLNRMHENIKDYSDLIVMLQDEVLSRLHRL